jgi:hypothetical protein
VARLTAVREELQRRVDELERGEAEELRMAREQRIADLEAELAAANAKLAELTVDKPDAFAASSPTPKPKRFSVFGGGAAKPKSKGAESFGDDDTLISTVARLREVQEELIQANTAKQQLEEALDRQTKWKEHFEAQVEQLKQAEDGGARLAREERIRALEAELAHAQAAKPATAPVAVQDSAAKDAEIQALELQVTRLKAQKEAAEHNLRAMQVSVRLWCPAGGVQVLTVL